MQTIEPEKKGRLMRQCARMVSYICVPYAIPLVAVTLLLFGTYLNNLPLASRFSLLGIIAAFTLLLPASAIGLYMCLHKLKPSHFHTRKNRFIPHLMFILSYIFCLVIMIRMRLPWYMTGIILSVLLMLVTSLTASLKWKLSEHAMGMGAILAGLVYFSAWYGFNPILWLGVCILLAGCVGTAVLILGNHTLSEVFLGYALGYACATLGLTPGFNILVFFLFRLIH